jgi:hypothetical protein
MSEGNLLQEFVTEIKPGWLVIETGTKRYGPNSTLRKHLWPQAKSIGIDFQKGEDVDVVVDIEKLTDIFELDSIDAIFSASTFEHIRKPWIAADQMLKVVKPGGLIFVQSHFCFPEHGYPFDYWRFTSEAWKVLFEDASEVRSSGEIFSKIVQPPAIPVWCDSAPVYCNSVALIKK